MAKYADIPCNEEFSTIRESIRFQEGLEATVILRCAWANRYLLMQELLGETAYPFPHTPDGWTTPYPINCATVPDETKYTTDADTQVITYEDALVTVQYGYIDVGEGPQDSDIPGEKVRLSETLEPTAEFLTQDYEDFVWATGEKPLKEGEEPGKLVRSFNLVRQHYNQKWIHGSALSLPGSVNDKAYSSKLLGMTFPTETLLFNPPSATRTITNLGPKGYNVTVKFTFKREGWNRFWRKDLQVYDRMKVKKIVLGGAGFELVDYYPYPLKNFKNWLF